MARGACRVVLPAKPQQPAPIIQTAKLTSQTQPLMLPKLGSTLISLNAVTRNHK